MRFHHEMEDETGHARVIISRDMLLAQLTDTEQDHAHWIEQQRGLIEKLGLANDLQSQMS